MSTDPLGLVGVSVSGYTVVRFCGSGAAGYVYEAHLGKERVALKFYKEWLFEQDAASQDARIARESNIRRVQHPNVCRVIGSGREVVKGVDRRWLAMEFIDGESLDSLIGTGMFKDWSAFADVTRQLFAGLSALHEAEHIHRDIKPANIVVERTTGRVVVTDFGVIADLEGATLLTESHAFLGTIAYAAPEWLLREAALPARSFAIDVYSLGATLFEMLTGERLFAALRNRHQLARAVADTVPTVHPPTGFPTGIASLVREMLAKDQANRPTLVEARSRLLNS
jgi:eukaryotic-like serine/threonine-protein kinase